MAAWRVYLDASALGGPFDEEFAEGSKEFVDALAGGVFRAILSDTLIGELTDAPPEVQDLLDKVIRAGAERVAVTPQATQLRDAYLRAGVVTPKYADDALHVAHATIAQADVIVSWNFRHLVNPSRVRGFNAVNSANGYAMVVILTPSDLVKTMEVGDEGEEDI